MTASYVTPPLGAPTVHAAINALRAAGLRVSAARRALLEALYAAPRPLTAEELAAGGDLASTYRNLDALEGLGLVRHLHRGHGPGLYSPAGARDHEYAVCEGCGAIHTFEASQLDGARAAIADLCGYAVTFGHFPLVGRCARCN
ncbi:MAG TPA: transcriptional repressor [Solirubrobacteraceae bacterium]